MDKLTRAVTLLQDERVLQQFTELLDYINIRVISNAAREFPQFALLSSQILPDLLQRGADTLESVEVKVSLIILQKGNLSLELVQLVENASDLANDVFLLLLAIFNVPQCLLVEIVCQE